MLCLLGISSLMLMLHLANEFRVSKDYEKAKLAFEKLQKDKRCYPRILNYSFYRFFYYSFSFFAILPISYPVCIKFFHLEWLILQDFNLKVLSSNLEIGVG